MLEHKLYFDELYDALFYRPAAALSVALRRNVEEPVVERSLDEIGSGTIQVGGEVARVQSGLLRTYAVAIAFAVCRPRRRLRGGALSMLTTALILLPIAGALVVAVLPLPRETTAGLAFLVALMEVGLWIVAAARFDFDDGGLQLGTSREWVESLGISYSVGFYGFSLWLDGRDGDRLRGRDRLRAVGRARPPARLPRAHALPARRGRRDVRRRRTSSSSTSRSRRC